MSSWNNLCILEQPNRPEALGFRLHTYVEVADDCVRTNLGLAPCPAKKPRVSLKLTAIVMLQRENLEFPNNEKKLFNIFSFSKKITR